MNKPVYETPLSCYDNGIKCRKEVLSLKELTNHPMSQPFTFEGDRTHGVLVLHGFTATPGTVLPLGQALAKDGHYVRGILLPGHGTTVEDMNKCTGLDWLRAAQKAFDEMAAICEKVSVVGLSMGGTLTLLLAETRPVYKAVPIAPALKIYRRSSRLAPAFQHTIPYLDSHAENEPEDFLSDYNVTYGCTPLPALTQLGHMMRAARRGLTRVDCPLLVVRAGKDRTVHALGIEWILRETSSRHKELLLLPESPHVCTLAGEREFLFFKVTNFLHH